MGKNLEIRQNENSKKNPSSKKNIKNNNLEALKEIFEAGNWEISPLFLADQTKSLSNEKPYFTNLSKKKSMFLFIAW